MLFSHQSHQVLVLQRCFTFISAWHHKNCVRETARQRQRHRDRGYMTLLHMWRSLNSPTSACLPPCLRQGLFCFPQCTSGYPIHNVLGDFLSPSHLPSCCKSVGVTGMSLHCGNQNSQRSSHLSLETASLMELANLLDGLAVNPSIPPSLHDVSRL